MKTPKFSEFMILLCAGAALGATSAGSAQTYDVVVIEKFSEQQQTDATTTVPNANPYGFGAFVEGTNLSGITAPTVTPPAGSGTGAVPLDYDAENDEWDHEVVFAGKGLLDTAYLDGDYTVDVAGASLTLNISGNLYPNIPLLSFNQGFWSAGVYHFDPGQDLVMTTNVFTDYSVHLEAFVSISAFTTSGPAYEARVQQFYSDVPATDYASLTLTALEIAAGQGLEVEVDFSAIIDYLNDAALPGADIAALYSTFTTLQLHAVPEMANSASLAGLGMLGFAALLRRRRG